MKHLLAPVVTILVLATSTSAAGQTKRVENSHRQQHQIRAIEARFGDCVVKKRYAAASYFVLTPEFEEESDWRRAVDKVADGDCLNAASASAGSVAMTFPADTMRYALAGALVRREFSSALSPSIKEAAPLIQPGLDEAEYVPKPGRKVKQAELVRLAENRSKRVATIYLAEYGECVVRAEVSRSHALIMSEPGSGLENAAFGSLTPALSVCLPPGKSLTFSKAILRGTIAMNFYRLAHAPKAAATAAGATR